MKKKIEKALSLTALGVFGGYNLVVHAYVIPGWNVPYDPVAYYSPTLISWADSPSAFALRDLARNFGSVYDYTRYVKSILFGDKFEKTAATNASETANDEINSTPFSEPTFLETSEALKIIGAGTEKITKTVALDETNPYFQQGNADDWESYDVSDSDRQAKYRWLDGTYRDFAAKSREALSETDEAIIAARKIIEHTNLAEGDLQLSQAQNELKTLLAYELARQNALDANFAQLQAIYHANEYDENVAAAYVDSVTKMDVVDPFDEVTYRMLAGEYDYAKPAPVGLPDFK